MNENLFVWIPPIDDHELIVLCMADLVTAARLPIWGHDLRSNDGGLKERSVSHNKESKSK